MSKQSTMTTAAGVPVTDNQNAFTAGPHGPDFPRFSVAGGHRRYVTALRDSRFGKLAGASVFLFFAVKGLLWILVAALGVLWIG
jgi:hypothetical protein